MKRTTKYIAGQKTARELGWNSQSWTNNHLYLSLEAEGYWWDRKAGEWSNDKQPSTTIFADDDGEATQVIKLRLMAHPDDMPQLERALRTAKGMKIIERSEKEYQNRNGAGVRVYITALLV